MEQGSTVLNLFSRTKSIPSVDLVYGDIVAVARLPLLYRDYGVPDTVMGRFEVLGLHVALVLRRLKALPPPADSLAQDVVDQFFAELDSSLREIGIGDVSVPKKIKKLGQAFYGRAQAYHEALLIEAASDSLEQALARNVLDKPTEPALATALAQHMRSVVAHLDTVEMAGFLTGKAMQSKFLSVQGVKVDG
jgi:cytochrome b pre-mRNA-processing protein 3